MTKLRLGIIGLGRRWRRYRLALRGLRDQLAIQAVYDASHERALRMARRLHCAATLGIVDLLERSDIDAILFLDAAWPGLWPLEAACRFNKPVFCAVPLDGDAGHAESVCRTARAAHLPVMAALPLRLAPATLRLHDLLRNHLGEPRMLLGLQTGPKFGRIRAALLDWCLTIFGAAPRRVRVREENTPSFVEVDVQFGDGRFARLCRCSGPYARRRLRFHVIAERGTAFIEMPARVCWSEADGRHSHVVAKSRPITEILLERFHQQVTMGQPIQPNLEDAYRAFKWLHASSRGDAQHDEAT
jgi:predicted dehydrogenase